MPFAAICYQVRPGHDDEIAEIFAADHFRRVDSPDLRDDQGVVVGRLLATGVFLQGSTMLRVIQYEGDIARLGAHLSRQPGVQEAERRLAPYLARPRDTGGAAAFQAHLGATAMTKLQERTISDRPATRLAALRYRVKPGHEQELAAVFAGVQRDARPTLRGDQGQDTGVIVAVALFVSGADMIRVVQFDGELDDVARYMAQRGPRPEIEAKLAPYLDEVRHVDTSADFLAQFRSNTMRCLSQLSVDTLPAG